MKGFLFLSLLLALSCTRYASFEKEAVGIHIQPVQMEIYHLEEMKWYVGSWKQETISQSFTFMIDLPKIKKDDLDYLSEHKGIDAWIVRIIASQGSKNLDLGSLYTIWKPKKMARGVQAEGTSSVLIKIYYAAGYASQRFRTFKCPAFGHDKRITHMSVEGHNDEFTISLSKEMPYKEKSQLVELSPSSFNAGNSLIGTYYAEIAAYDSKRKMIHSSFKRIPMSIRVSGEERVRVKSCEGIHEERQ
jgi:hypothetical protein